MSTTTYNTFIALAGDSTTRSSPSVKHNGWGEAFSGITSGGKSTGSFPTFNAPWNLTAIQKEYSGITDPCLNFGKPGAIPLSYYQSKQWNGLLESNPVYAFLMFGADGGTETSWKKHMTSMCTDLINAGVTPFILSMVPPRVPSGAPAPAGSSCYNYAAWAKDVAGSNKSIVFIDSFTTLVNYFTTQGGTWVINNIDSTDGEGLVHYQPHGAAYIAQQIANILPNDITEYLNDSSNIASNFSCTANCSYSSDS